MVIAALVAGAVVSLSAVTTASAAPAPAAAATATSLPVVTQDVTQLSAFDAELLRLINVQRTNAALPPLLEARGLSTLSTWWSNQEATGATGGGLDHNPDGMYMASLSGASARTEWAENVMRFSTASQVKAQDVFNAYFASPTHRANILSTVYDYIGIGTVTDPAGLSYNTMNFTDAADAGQTYDPRAALTPIGHYEALGLTGATVRIQGWALDPEITTAASTVRFVDTAPDGTVVNKSVTANVSRPDVRDDYPTSGANHGFDYSYVTSGRGAHTVCATVINTGGGLGDVALGCLGYTVGDPVGALSSASVSGTTLTVGGWAVDPDQPTTAASVTITDTRQITGATSTLKTFVANQTNTVAGTTVPGAGNLHGFSGTTAISGSGIHTVCASSAALRNPDVTTNLGCATVTVAGSQKPVGALDTVTTPTDETVTVTGWAADPGYPTSASTITVKITTYKGLTQTKGILSGGVYATEVSPGFGRNHGFSATLPLPIDGTSSICVTAVSRDDATLTTDLGCKSVTENWLDGWMDKVTPNTDAKGVRTLAIKGWAIDQAAPTATVTTKIAVTAPNGTVSTTPVLANGLRGDVGDAHPGAGDYHGLASTIKVTAAGTYKVCGTAFSTGNPDITKSLSCTSVVVK